MAVVDEQEQVDVVVKRLARIIKENGWFYVTADVFDYEIVFCYNDMLQDEIPVLELIHKAVAEL